MNLLNSLFTLMLVYGYPAIAAAVFLSSTGIPLPGVSILLVAGSLAATGNHNIILLYILVTVCSVAGDLLDYYLGIKVGYPLIERLSKRSTLVRKSLTTLQRYFAHWSGCSVFFTRWLITFLGPTVSVFAGLTKMPLGKYLVFDILGEMVSTVIFLGLGYEFSVNWPTILAEVNLVDRVVIGGALGLAFIFFGVRSILHAKQV